MVAPLAVAGQALARAGQVAGRAAVRGGQATARQGGRLAARAGRGAGRRAGRAAGKGVEKTASTGTRAASTTSREAGRQAGRSRPGQRQPGRRRGQRQRRPELDRDENSGRRRSKLGRAHTALAQSRHQARRHAGEAWRGDGRPRSYGDADEAVGKAARRSGRALRRAGTLAPRLITAPARLLILLAQPHKLVRKVLWLGGIVLVVLMLLAPIWLIADDEAEDTEMTSVTMALLACDGVDLDGDVAQATRTANPDPPLAAAAAAPAVFPSAGGGPIPAPGTLPEVAALADPAEMAQLRNLTGLGDLTNISSTGPTARAAIGYTDRQPATIDSMDMPRVLAALRTIESGSPQGNYSAYNNHGGAAGAYQFLPGTWQGLGGSGSARDATQEEQDRRAQQYLAELNAANPGPLSLSAGLSWFLGPGGVRPFMTMPWESSGWDPARDGEGSSARSYRARFSLAYVAVSLQGDVGSSGPAASAAEPRLGEFADFPDAEGLEDVEDFECDFDDMDSIDGSGQLGQASHPGSGAVGVDGYSLPLDGRFYDNNPEWFTKPHHGTNPASDIPVAVGTPVYAMVDGEVVQRNPGGLCGWGVVIMGDDGGRYIYCHASVVPDRIQPGRRVQAGDQVMLTGGASGHAGAGRSTGPHLHVGLEVDGVAVCPQRLFVDIAAGDDIDISRLSGSGCNSGQVINA